MNALTLYVDKWYIVGTIVIDDSRYPLTLSNREDRIWLYFYNDENNNQVTFGKSNRKHCLDNERNYYGNIFSLIIDSRKTYKRYEHEKEIKEIFSDSKVFEDLRSSFTKLHALQDDQKIPVYISFSRDVNAYAQQVFIQEMTGHGFDVKGFLLSIDLISIRYFSLHTGAVCKDGNYVLVLNAAGDNLYATFYKAKNGLFEQEGETFSLSGYGMDVRNHAIVQLVVDKVNNFVHLLKSPSEKEQEYVRLSERASDWIRRIDNGKPFIPTKIDKVAFAAAPQNVTSVSIMRKELEDNTQGIIREIVRNIQNFVSGTSINASQIDQVILLGSSFFNSAYQKEFRSWLSMNDKNSAQYNDDKMADIVSFYPVVASDYGKRVEALSVKFQNDAAQCKKQQKDKEKKEKEEQQRQEAIARGFDVNAQDEENRSKYNDYMRQAVYYKEKGNYALERDFLNKALHIYPDNEEPLRMLKDLDNKESEARVKTQKYNTSIALADNLFNSENYEEALVQYSTAHSIDPEGKYASEKIAETTQILKTKKDIKEHLDKADLFEANNLQEQAIEELNRALSLDPRNEKIIKRKEMLSKAVEDKINKINQLQGEFKNAVNAGDYDKAMESCEKLASADTKNTRLWLEKKLEYKKLRDDQQLKKAKLKQVLNDINKAAFSENWEKVRELCQLYLSQEESVEIRDLLNKAGKNIQRKADEAIKAKWNQMMTILNTYMFNEDWENVIKTGMQALAIREDIEVRKKLDIAKEKVTRKGRLPEPQRPRHQSKKLSNNDDFFSNDSNHNKPKPITGFHPNGASTKPAMPTPKPKKSGDDFFDSDNFNKAKLTPKGQGGQGRLTNDDFNF